MFGVRGSESSPENPPKEELVLLAGVPTKRFAPQGWVIASMLHTSKWIRPSKKGREPCRPGRPRRTTFAPRLKITAAVIAFALPLGTQASEINNVSGSITVWSWNTAAEALSNLLPDFNKEYPGIKVAVINMGHSDVRDRALAQCAAGGSGLADVVTIESQSAEQFWHQFPDCFMDLNTLGYERVGSGFAAAERLGLSVGTKAYAMPWDTGPSAVFYRRDLFQLAGISPESLQTWDDFIAAGKKLKIATDGRVAMIQDDKGGDDALFRQLAVQDGCFYFSNDGSSITITQKGCIEALQTIKKMWDAGIVSPAGWDQKIQSFKASVTATEVYGGWYAGTISNNAPDQAGKWGVLPLPAFKLGGNRASCTGGSSLAISAKSKNAAAAFAFISYALATKEGQVSMLKYRSLVPALLSASDDPYVSMPQSYWGGEAIWAVLLSTRAECPSYRTTAYYNEAADISKVVVSDYLDGRYPSAVVALHAAADQISASTGLPIVK